jgi:two-component system, cell cycle response regulator
LSTAYKIVLLGFTSFETGTFESFFRLAARRAPGYVLTRELSLADLVIVNADDANAVSICVASQNRAKVLLIGADDRNTGWTVERRPLNLMKVLHTIDRLLGESSPKPTTQGVSNNSEASSGARSGISPNTEPNRAGIHQKTKAVEESVARSNLKTLSERAKGSVRTGPGTLEPIPLSPKIVHGSAPSTIGDAPSDLDHILVVDDSDIALKFMRNRLTRFGFHADLVSSGEEALARMNVRSYKFVFLDVMMEGLDGYQTCRAIKQRKYSDGKPPRRRHAHQPRRDYR